MDAGPITRTSARSEGKYLPVSRLLLVFLGAVALMIAITSIEGALFRIHRGDPVDWADLIFGRALAWLTCAAFIPPLYLLTTVLPVGRRRWHVALPAHVAASVIATVGKYSLYVPLLHVLDSRSTAAWLDHLRRGFLGEVLFYWAMIGLCHALFYYRYSSKRAENIIAAATGENASARLSFSTGAAQEMLHPDDIYWVAAEGNYVQIHLAERRLLVRHTLHALESKLPRNFLRVQRSVIVNGRMVRRVEGLGRGKYRLQLVNGAAIETGVSYKEAVRQLAASPPEACQNAPVRAR